MCMLSRFANYCFLYSNCEIEDHECTGCVSGGYIQIDRPDRQINRSRVYWLWFMWVYTDRQTRQIDRQITNVLAVFQVGTYKQTDRQTDRQTDHECTGCVSGGYIQTDRQIDSQTVTGCVSGGYIHSGVRPDTRPRPDNRILNIEEKNLHKMVLYYLKKG